MTELKPAGNVYGEDTKHLSVTTFNVEDRDGNKKAYHLSNSQANVVLQMGDKDEEGNFVSELNAAQLKLIRRRGIETEVDDVPGITQNATRQAIQKEVFNVREPSGVPGAASLVAGAIASSTPSKGSEENPGELKVK